jgi:hypothetical protein
MPPLSLLEPPGDRFMKRVLFWLGGAALVVFAAGVAVFRQQSSPAGQPPAAAQTAVADSVADSEVLERGRYLFHHVANCAFCHSPHEDDAFGWPIQEGKLGAGMCMPDFYSMPGKVCSPNITPHPERGVGQWSDEELITAFRENTGRGGTPLFPHHSLYGMADSDARSLVAYMRTLPALDHHSGDTDPRMRRKIPRPDIVPAATPPDRADRALYGKYLVDMAGCAFCHTGEGEDGAEVPFAGGFVFEHKGYKEVSRNITPHPTAGIGQFSEPLFVLRFKAWNALAPTKIEAGMPNQKAMPWRAFAGMTEEDLGAIFAYLKTLPPVSTPVQLTAQ